MEFRIANYAPRYYAYINITKDKEIACKPFKSYLMGAIIGCSNIRRIAETYKRLPGNQYNAFSFIFRATCQLLFQFMLLFLKPLFQFAQKANTKITTVQKFNSQNYSSRIKCLLAIRFWYINVTFGHAIDCQWEKSYQQYPNRVIKENCYQNNKKSN